MEKRNQPLNGINELDSAQWAEYWALKQRNDADARRDFWRSLAITAGIVVPALVCLCVFVK